MRLHLNAARCSKLFVAMTLCGALLSSASVYSQDPNLVLYEGFDYSTTASTTTMPASEGDRSLSGVVLPGSPNISFANTGGYQNSFTGTKWAPININSGGTVYNTAADVNIVANSLSYSGLATSVGNSVSSGGIGYSPRLLFSPITTAGDLPAASTPGPAQGVTSYDGNASPSSLSAAYGYNGSLFYSALLRVDSLSPSANAAGDMVMHFHAVTTQGTGQASAHFAGAYVKPNPDDPNTFFLGVSKGEGSGGVLATYGTTPYTLGSTLMIVGQWEFVANVGPNFTARQGNDVARLYVNPTTLGGSEGSSGATVITDVGGASDDLPVGSVALTSFVISQRQAGVPNATIDEIRVGRTFASVTPAGASPDNADFDGDGDVDGADFLTWQRGIGETPTLANGNANGDGAIDGADLAVWEGQHGTATIAATPVPEPAGALLLLTGALVVARRVVGRPMR